MYHFDPLPEPQQHVGWYRCTTPPGCRSVRFAARGAVQLWIDGTSVPITPGEPDPARFPSVDIPVWQAVLPAPSSHEGSLAIRIVQERGYYGGSAIPDPVVFDCTTGLIMPGDLAQDRALTTYSGGMLYSKTVALTVAQAGARKILLDLGDLVSSVRVKVNGETVGVRPAPPWQFDITGKAQPGSNRIEVLVHNTLGNHYQTLPSLYTGSASSGLIGPIKIRYEE
jgi:hypothetical protein